MILIYFGEIYLIYAYILYAYKLYMYNIIYINGSIYYGKDFPKERYCTCVYLCNLIIRYGHLAVLI